VTGGLDPATVFQSDFILPPDESIQRALSINLYSLSLIKAANSVTTTPRKASSGALGNSSQIMAIQTYFAVMNFLLDAEREEQKEIDIPLRYDVNFAAAHPCVLPQLTPSTNRSSQNPGVLGSGIQRGTLTRNTEYNHEVTMRTGHFLHKIFTYKTVSLFELLISSSTISSECPLPPFSIPLDAGSCTSETTTQTSPGVLVVDCMDASMTAYPVRPTPSPQVRPCGEEFGSDMELLARSLCAYRGWNAVISRRGRGCLACAIREAAALKWSVVLRFA
jgi:hypothetical protein